MSGLSKRLAEIEEKGYLRVDINTISLAVNKKTLKVEYVLDRVDGIKTEVYHKCDQPVIFADENIWCEKCGVIVYI